MNPGLFTSGLIFPISNIITGGSSLAKLVSQFHKLLYLFVYILVLAKAEMMVKLLASGHLGDLMKAEIIRI